MHVPILSQVAPGVTMIDTGMGGERALNAVYVFGGAQPCLVEAAPEADGTAVLAGLEQLDIGPNDLAHVVVTHIHMDHAGGAGALLERFPGARVWVHERGAPHLANPTRLVASTARTYGAARMYELFGGMRACEPERISAVVDGDLIDLGDHRLRVLETPGHASHHIALHDEAGGAVCTGEAIGSYLPWATAFRPALPPPEVDVELALASIERIRRVGPSVVLTSHFGPAPQPDRACEVAAERVRAWAEVVRRSLIAEPDASTEAIASSLRDLAEREYFDDAGRPLDDELERYDALGSIAMNAAGLARYWRKRWEAETGGSS
jgi:glyoxylase-like metal-dependent hydrolase (beta-lactamase superfamily II)